MCTVLYCRWSECVQYGCSPIFAQFRLAIDPFYLKEELFFNCIEGWQTYKETNYCTIDRASAIYLIASENVKMDILTKAIPTN